MDCCKCGWCCFVYGGGVRATPADMKRWDKEGRVDILDLFGAGDRWTTELQCPYLVKVKGKPEFVCGIQETKPTDCDRWDFCNKEIAQKFQSMILGKTRNQIIKIAEELFLDYEKTKEYEVYV